MTGTGKKPGQPEQPEGPRCGGSGIIERDGRTEGYPDHLSYPCPACPDCCPGCKEGVFDHECISQPTDPTEEQQRDTEATKNSPVSGATKNAAEQPIQGEGEK